MMQNDRMREKCLRNVQIHSFATDEARLYLDMHPDDEGAKQYFDRQNALRRQAIMEYERSHGPILSDNINACRDGWHWCEQPMPWEMGVQW